MSEPTEPRIEKMFDRVADHYDRLNDRLSLGLHRFWKKRLISKLGPCSGLRVLDAATGTGDLALSLARRGAMVTGLDLSEGMLSVARQRGREIVPQPTWVLADAHNLPFEDASFDAVLVSFGVRNFRDPALGIRELWRVLRPGGCLFILEFGSWQRLFFFRTLMRWAVRFWRADPDAYEYLIRSSTQFPSGSNFEQAFLEPLGCRQKSEYRSFAGIVHWYEAWKSHKSQKTQTESEAKNGVVSP